MVKNDDFWLRGPQKNLFFKKLITYLAYVKKDSRF